MRAEKQIITTEPVDITIDKITLLSAEEYEQCKEHIPVLGEWWWLRSPGCYGDYAAYVGDNGGIYDIGSDVSDSYGSVRPVVVLRLNPESVNLQIGDKLHFAGYSWTMIAPDMALCDEAVGRTCFRKDWRAPNANDYEKSDVKVWLEKWAQDNGIEVGA